VRILAFGDMGQKPQDECHQAQGDAWKKQEFSEGDPGALDTVLALQQDHEAQPADVVFHNGDLSYAMGYSAVWESFQQAIESLAAVVPWMVTMGNHERDWPSSGSSEGDRDSMGECGLPALRRFPALPYASTEAAPNDQPWWKMSLGSVFLLALSTEHDVARGSAQWNFLEASLASVDRRRTPWVVLAGHRPYHVSSNWADDQDFPRRFRAAVGELVEKDVDLILGAHHHSYQRSCPLQRDRCGEGPVVVNLGMGGAGLNTANKTMPPLFRYVDDKHFGYCRIVANATVLSVEFVHSLDAQVYDRVLLQKAAPDLTLTQYV